MIVSSINGVIGRVCNDDGSLVYEVRWASRVTLLEAPPDFETGERRYYAPCMCGLLYKVDKKAATMGFLCDACINLRSLGARDKNEMVRSLARHCNMSPEQVERLLWFERHEASGTSKKTV